MKNTFTLVAILLLLCTSYFSGYSQKNTLTFNANKEISADNSKNPFKKFIGEWTLKDDNWSQNWGGKDEHIKILGHHTVCRAINTDNSLLLLTAHRHMAIFSDLTIRQRKKLIIYQVLAPAEQELVKALSMKMEMYS